MKLSGGITPIMVKAPNLVQMRMLSYTVKPLYNGHHRDVEKVSALRRCPLCRGSAFFFKK